MDSEHEELVKNCRYLVEAWDEYDAAVTHQDELQDSLPSDVTPDQQREYQNAVDATRMAERKQRDWVGGVVGEAAKLLGSSIMDRAR